MCGSKIKSCVHAKTCIRMFTALFTIEKKKPVNHLPINKRFDVYS